MSRLFTERARLRGEAVVYESLSVLGGAPQIDAGMHRAPNRVLQPEGSENTGSWPAFNPEDAGRNLPNHRNFHPWQFPLGTLGSADDCVSLCQLSLE